MNGWSFGVVALMCAAVWDAGFSQKRPDKPNKMVQEGQAGESCFSGIQTARNVAGKPIVLTTKQLDKRATLRVMPNYPVLLQLLYAQELSRICPPEMTPHLGTPKILR